MKVTMVGTEADYVVQTYWTKTGTDENGNTGVFSGATPLDPNPDQVDFIPYDQLTNDIVVGWIQQELGVNGVNTIEACIQGQIDSQINPPVTPEVTPLPPNFYPAP
jgi:hypothetical protein